MLTKDLIACHSILILRGVAFCDDPDMSKVSPKHKIQLLRVLLAEDDIDAFVCLSEDSHNSEYVR